MANLTQIHLVRTSTEQARQLAEAHRKLARRIREEQARQPLQQSLKGLLQAALK